MSDVTYSTSVTLQPAHDLTFYFGMHGPWGLPGIINVTLCGTPTTGPWLPIPGTNAYYQSGALLTGTIQSTDGLTVRNLVDPDASRVGLPVGSMLLKVSDGGAGSPQFSYTTATVSLTPADASALFASGQAVVDLHNAGSVPLAFGHGPLAYAFNAALTSADGTVGYGAIISKVLLS